MFRYMGVLAATLGLDPPTINSGCRSAALQRAMQENWDTGDHEGLAVRPATDSLHVPDESGVCRAFDLGNDLAWLARIGPATVAGFPGLRWGGLWLPRDPWHFDFPKRYALTIRLT